MICEIKTIIGQTVVKGIRLVVGKRISVDMEINCLMFSRVNIFPDLIMICQDNEENIVAVMPAAAVSSPTADNIQPSAAVANVTE